MKLIKEANQWYKMASVWVFVSIAFLTIVEEKWDDVFVEVMPNNWYPYIVAILAILGVAARLIDQGIRK